MKHSTRSALRACALCLAALLPPLSGAAKDTKHSYSYSVTRTMTQEEASLCPVQAKVLAAHLGVQASAITSSFASSTVRFYAVQPSGKYYTSATLSPWGHYFTTAGVVTTSASRAACSSQFDGKGSVKVLHHDKAADGETYTWKQAFVNTATSDTVELSFTLAMGSKPSVSTDMPAVVHRADNIDAWMAVPSVRVNDQAPLRQDFAQLNAGDRLTLGLAPRNAGETVVFNVKSPSGTVLRGYKADDFELKAAEPDDAGYYTLSIRRKADGKTTIQQCQFVVDVQTNRGENYDWAANTPYWSYDFRDEYPDGFPAPTKIHSIYKKNGTRANCVEGEWWSVFWGDNLNAEVDADNKNAMTNMMKKFDEDFAYIRDEMGWPPDLSARDGYKSYVYVFGSGLNADNASNTEQGGYQGNLYVDGKNYPNVWASYYPVSRFRDDADSKWNDGEYQREAMIHEGIHAIFADMNGVKNSAWFHEGGNTWLQSAMNTKRSGTYGEPGFLDACPFIAPFMPIECYSGWLQDGSFGGPSAEGVNMFNASGQQVCTWRNLLGGTQYGNGFAIFLGEAVGQGTIPWIWRWCKNRVLQGIAEGNASAGVSGIGEEAMRSLIMQYRAKQATFDIGGFAPGYRKIVNNNFGGTVKAEWSPYWIDVAPFKLTPYQTLDPNDEDGWLAPDTITNPGWSGANIIPVHVEGGHCAIEYRPEDANMRAQLCYRTRDGRCFYSQPVLAGTMELNWTADDAPANGVVFCVVCNTDYIFVNDDTRKKHFDYRVRLGDGALGVASKDIRWYFYEQTLKDNDFLTGVGRVEADGQAHAYKGIRLMSTELRGGQQVQLDLNGIPASELTAHLVGASGVVIDEQPVSAGATVQLPAGLPRGLYILSLLRKGDIQAFKIYVK